VAFLSYLLHLFGIQRSFSTYFVSDVDQTQPFDGYATRFTTWCGIWLWTLWYTIYDIYRLLNVLAPWCHSQDVTVTRTYKSTCQSSFCSSLEKWIKSWNAKIH